MKDFQFLLDHFFTHKDFLPPAEQLPGSLYTPLHFIFEGVLLLLIIAGTILLCKRKEFIKPAFIGMWVCLMVLEAAIQVWELTQCKSGKYDFVNNLSLYPCSIFLYTMPLAIWGTGKLKKIACGYVCTLGMLGAVVNFLFPISRLTDYSCISFPGMHTFIFHGSMLFAFLVMIFSGYHSYRNVEHWWELFLPCIASLVVSIPANIINYSKINADYMYFKGRFFVLAKLFGDTPEIMISVIIYLLYIGVPALFYLPSFIHRKRRMEVNK